MNKYSITVKTQSGAINECYIKGSDPQNAIYNLTNSKTFPSGAALRSGKAKVTKIKQS